MSERNNNVCVSIYDFQPDHLYSEDEIAELRKEAWVDLGILIVSAYDERLTPQDLHTLVTIGERFYEEEESFL